MYIGVGVDGTLCSSRLCRSRSAKRALRSSARIWCVRWAGGRRTLQPLKMHAAVAPDRRRKRCDRSGICGKVGRWVGR